MRILDTRCRLFRHEVALSPSPGYLYNDPMSERVHVTFATVCRRANRRTTPLRLVPASHAELGFTLLISCGTRLSSLGSDLRRRFIPNASVGLLKLLEPLDTSPQRESRDGQPHTEAQYRNL